MTRPLHLSNLPLLQVIPAFWHRQASRSGGCSSVSAIYGQVFRVDSNRASSIMPADRFLPAHSRPPVPTEAPAAGDGRSRHRAGNESLWNGEFVHS